MMDVKKKRRLKRKIKSIVILSSVFIVVAGFFAGIGAVGYKVLADNSDKAIVIMTLNYENSSHGLNPDNSKFNLRFLKGEEVLTDVLLETDMYQYLKPAELSSFIHIKGASSKPIDVNSDIKYIDSTYKITLELPKKYTEFISAKNLLGEICESYQEWFTSSYVVDSKALNIDTTCFEDMEYTEISSYFDMMALRGKNYLSRKDESTMAFTGSDGTTWKSLYQELCTLTDYDINTFNQYIWENGIAKNNDWAVTIFEYKNNDLNIEYELLMDNVQKYEYIVDQYRNEMTSSVLIPTYDDLDQFYMSRTKTGIDKLSKSMNQYLGDATSLKEKIDLNNDRINKLENSSIVSTEKADIMLHSIHLKITDIFNRIKKLDTEYVNRKTDGYIKYEFVETGFNIPFF